MSISSRIHDTLEAWQLEWRDRLRGWMASWVIKGVTEFMDGLEPEAQDSMRATLTQIKGHPMAPPEIRSMIDRILTPGSPIPLLLIIPLAVLMFIPTITSIFIPLGNLLRYVQERLVRSWRLDPMAVITAWRRDPEKYAHLFDDLKEQGWSDDRIEALKFYTLFYPAPADLVRWQAREVFEPAMITKYGLDDELAGIDRESFYKAGMTDEQITNYWRAHWEHASYMQMVEMLHRKLITEADFSDWFRLVEVVPFWRPNLIQTAYTWPTRVDVRRFWDMRTIDEPRLRELYEGMGYRGKNLEDYIKWTKVYVDFPMMMARFTKGWITEDDIYNWLIAQGIPAERARHFIEEKVEAEKPERIVKERDLTKSEITKGLKAEKLKIDEAMELLQEMGYDADEAEYIIEVNLGIELGSPETYEDFKKWTALYRKAARTEVKTMPEELKAAADKVVEVTKQIEDLERAIKEEEAKLVTEEVLPEEATARRDELQVALHRAESVLFRVKLDYDRLLAEWRHGA